VTLIVLIRRSRLGLDKNRTKKHCVLASRLPAGGRYIGEGRGRALRKLQMGARKVRSRRSSAQCLPSRCFVVWFRGMAAGTLRLLPVCDSASGLFANGKDPRLTEK